MCANARRLLHLIHFWLIQLDHVQLYSSINQNIILNNNILNIIIILKPCWESYKLIGWRSNKLENNLINVKLY